MWIYYEEKKNHCTRVQERSRQEIGCSVRGWFAAYVFWRENPELITLQFQFQSKVSDQTWSQHPWRCVIFERRLAAASEWCSMNLRSALNVLSLSLAVFCDNNEKPTRSQRLQAQKSMFHNVGNSHCLQTEERKHSKNQRSFMPFVYVSHQPVNIYPLGAHQQ